VSLVVDEEGIRLGCLLESVLIASFSVLTLLVECRWIVCSSYMNLFAVYTL